MSQLTHQFHCDWDESMGGSNARIAYLICFLAAAASAAAPAEEAHWVM